MHMPVLDAVCRQVRKASLVMGECTRMEHDHNNKQRLAKHLGKLSRYPVVKWLDAEDFLSYLQQVLLHFAQFARWMCWSAN